MILAFPVRTHQGVALPLAHSPPRPQARRRTTTSPDARPRRSWRPRADGPTSPRCPRPGGGAARVLAVPWAGDPPAPGVHSAFLTLNGAQPPLPRSSPCGPRQERAGLGGFTARGSAGAPSPMLDAGRRRDNRPTRAGGTLGPPDSGQAEELASLPAPLRNSAPQFCPLPVQSCSLSPCPSWGCCDLRDPLGAP